jgi:hypothetical protein
MHVTVLVPGIHDRPTGGNIYNRRVIAEMRRRRAVDVVSWAPEDTGSPDLDGADEGVIVVDSLLARHEQPLRALRRAHPAATLVLLAHYLHCIDPNERDTPAATTERAALPLFDGTVTTGRYAQRALAEEGVPNDRIAVVPPGLDEAYRAPVPERSDREGPPRLLTVASLLPGKGLRVLVDVLSDLTDRAWTWTLVGDDTLDPGFADALHDQVRDAALAERATLTGAVSADAVRAQYDRADVFVLPSRFETCSMATREAMARGLPVVACDVGGLPDNFGEAAGPGSAPAGALVPPGDPDALSEALRTLLTDPAARMRRGQAAWERGRAFPGWGEAGRRFHEALGAFHAPSE